MAPEQARGETPDERCDVFALGGLLYSLLVRDAPIRGGVDDETLKYSPPDRWDMGALQRAGVGGRLEKICRRALQADPKHRYPGAEPMARDLERFVDRPRRLALATASAATLLAVALTAWWFWPTAMPTGDDGPAGKFGSGYRRESPDFEPQLQVLVRRGDQFAELARAMPLKEDDHLSFSCQVPPGAYALLVWFDSAGYVQRLTPQRTTSPTADRLHFPGPQQSVDLGYLAGTEFVLLCVRRSKPIDFAEEVEGLFEPGQPWPEMPSRSIVLLDRDRVHAVAQSIDAWADEVVQRAVPSGLDAPADSREAGVVRQVERIRARLAERFDFVLGVAFTNTAEQVRADAQAAPVEPDWEER
jgi:hypothetical protein